MLKRWFLLKRAEAGIIRAFAEVVLSQRKRQATRLRTILKSSFCSLLSHHIFLRKGITHRWRLLVIKWARLWRETIGSDTHCCLFRHASRCAPHRWNSFHCSSWLIVLLINHRPERVLLRFIQALIQELNQVLVGNQCLLIFSELLLKSANHSLLFFEVFAQLITIFPKFTHLFFELLTTTLKNRFLVKYGFHLKFDRWTLFFKLCNSLKVLLDDRG